MDPIKPIIYLYPETETELSVKLGKPEKITVSYPAYGDGWHVLAQPDGALVDIETGRNLYALYWEGKDPGVLPLDEGFVVASADTAAFLEEKLALLGLSDREAEEFIVYWLPLLQKNAYNLIRFETMEEIEDDTIQQTPGTLPPADQTGEYANTLKAARDAMMDGRFDSAYTNSIRLIAMKPDVPELIAIQALSILGKEKMALDIPASTCKGMERFHSMFGTWKAVYSEQVKAIRNVQSYVDLACQAQVAALR